MNKIILKALKFKSLKLSMFNLNKFKHMKLSIKSYKTALNKILNHICNYFFADCQIKTEHEKRVQYFFSGLKLREKENLKSNKQY